MKGRWRQGLASVLCAAMCLGLASGGFDAQAQTPENQNLALGKPVTASSVEGGEGTYPHVAPAGVTDGTWDGYRSDVNNRWSSGTKKEDQWVYIDLGETQDVNRIDIYWENVENLPATYELQYTAADTPEGWVTVETEPANSTAENGQWSRYLMETVQARYLRVFIPAQESATRFDNWGIWEVLAFSISGEYVSLDEAAAQLQSQLDTLVVDPATMDQMPEFTYNGGGITGKLFCSENDVIINDQGQVLHQPLVNKKVQISYELTDTMTGQTKMVENRWITVKGEQEALEHGNPQPEVVPTLQEWYGQAEGAFTLTENSAIVVPESDQALLQTAGELMKSDIQELFGLDLDVVNRAAQPGDIVLTTAQARSDIGDQGYTMTVGDTVTVSAQNYRAVYFGTRSVLQALLSGDGSIGYGTAVDYPNYPVRKLMFEVARTYFPMWDLEDLAEYASWYKLTDFQVHVSDNTYNDYAGFRLESDIPYLTSTDGYYTKEEYRQFQKDAEKRGIRIITEVDTPAHSQCFINIGKHDDVDDKYKGLGLSDGIHLDIVNEPAKTKVYDFIRELYEEYMGGDDPVIVTDAFGVGLDEYPYGGAPITEYSKFVMELAHSYGKQPFAWASSGYTDMEGIEVPDYTIMDFWAAYVLPGGPQSLLDTGMRIVNANEKYYVVPGGNIGFWDYPDQQTYYTNLRAGDLGGRSGGGIQLPEGHPQIVGGNASIWNDCGIFIGITEYDVFARQKGQLPILGQYYWYGREEGEDYAEFKEKVDNIGAGPGLENLDKSIDSQTEQVYRYEMEEVTADGEALVIHDMSGNGYDAKAYGATVTSDKYGKQLTFSGDGRLEMPHTALAWPYTMMMELTIDEQQSGDIILFEEDMPEQACNQQSGITTGHEKRTMYLKETEQGYQLMYDRSGNHYEHSFLFQKGKTYSLAFTSDEQYSRLYVDGQQVSAVRAPIRDDVPSNGSGWVTSASLNLPLQRAMVNLYGTIDSLKVYNYQMSAEEIAEACGTAVKENLALHKPVTASSVEGGEGTYPYVAAAGVTDGTWDAYRTDVNNRWSSGPKDEDQWVYVDLEDVRSISQVDVYWEALQNVPKTYEIQYTASETLDGWQKIEAQAQTQDTEMGQWARFTFDAVSARYLRVWIPAQAQENKWNNWGIWEIMAYEENHAALGGLIDSLREQAAQLGPEITQENRNAFLKHLDEAQKIADDQNTPLPDDEFLQLKADLLKLFDLLKSGGNLDVTQANKTLLQKTYDYALTLSTEGVTDAAKEAFEEALANAKAVLDKADASQDEVNAAWDALLEGIWSLGLTQGDKTMLEQLIAKAESMIPNEDKYVADHWKEVVNALAEAKKVMDDGNAMDEDIQPVAEALLDAILAQRFKADKSILEDLIGKAVGINLDGYTAESVAVFRAALAEAQAVMADETLSEDDQSTVDAAVDKLTAAMDGLTAGGAPEPSEEPEATDKPETSQKPEATDKPQTTDKPEGEGPAQTGDTAQLMLYVVALAAAVLAMGGLVEVRKRNQK